MYPMAALPGKSVLWADKQEGLENPNSRDLY